MGIESELVRGAGSTAVLALLEQRPLYGYELAEALDRATDGVLAMGQSTLYPMLYSLEAKGLVHSVTRIEAGRRRRYYEPTDAGRRFLTTRRGEWKGLFGALAALGVVDAPAAGTS